MAAEGVRKGLAGALQAAILSLLDRRVISGILHVLRSGCRWIDCPAVYGLHTTVYNRFHRWSGRGRWQVIFETLSEAVPKDTRVIDSTSIKSVRTV